MPNNEQLEKVIRQFDDLTLEEKMLAAIESERDPRFEDFPDGPSGDTTSVLIKAIRLQTDKKEFQQDAATSAVVEIIKAFDLKIGEITAMM